MFDPLKPYNELPLLPPRADLYTPRIAKKLVLASRALAGLSSSRALPNQHVLLNSVFLREAKESSEIENIVTTDDELFHAMIESEKEMSPSSKEVLRYVEAVWMGMKAIQAQPLSTNVFVQIVRTIKKTDAGIRNYSGIKIKNDKTGEIIYTPPEGEELIREKLFDLEKFLHSESDIDPLLKMAIAHYQFEAIHPFGDGNGRTGRIINLLYLVQSGLLKTPILYLSKYIIEHKEAYYLGLRAVTENGHWEDWILYMLEAIERTSVFTQNKIEEIYKAMSRTKDRMKENNLYSKDLLDLLFQQPYSRAMAVVQAGIFKELTARKYLDGLAKVGILRKLKVGRENLFINQDFLRILTSD